jgi:hypothetical protein
MSEWQHWQDNLAGNKPPIHDGDPQPGFYKRRVAKKGPWIPVAIWRKEDGEMLCRVGDKPSDPVDEWTWVAKHPVTKDAAKFAFENDNKWPEDVEVTDDASADIYDSNDPAEALQMAISVSLEWVSENKITTEKLAEKAANLKSKVAEKRLAADKARKAEKQPHLDAGRAVDEKYNPLIKDAKDAEKQIGEASRGYLLEKKRKADAIAAKAAKAAREEQERLEKEQRAAQHNLPPEERTEPIPVTPPPAPTKVSVGGASGRKMTIKEDVEYVVVDHKKALEYFAAHEDVVDLIAKLATRFGKNGVIADGVERKVVEVIK